MRYLVYLRVSTDKQDEEMQNHHCMKYVSSVNQGFPVVEFRDHDVSTRLPIHKRPALTNMLDAVKRGDVVVIFKLDRLSRDIVEMVNIHRMIVSKHAKVYSFSEPHIEDWMLGIFGSMAQKQRETISHNIKSKMAEKRAKGERLGRIPYGFKFKCKGEIEVCAEEAYQLAFMYHLRTQRLYSFRDIAMWLTQRGLCNRKNTPWTHGATSRVYKNYLLVKEVGYKLADQIPGIGAQLVNV